MQIIININTLLISAFILISLNQNLKLVRVPSSAHIKIFSFISQKLNHQISHNWDLDLYQIE
ncbi:hypothetical protein Hanom_Chr12g01145211 [Helianthus anomalus]